MEKIKTIYVIAYLLTAIAVGTLFFGMVQLLYWITESNEFIDMIEL